jgi:hypothetical protein
MNNKTKFIVRNGILIALWTLLIVYIFQVYFAATFATGFSFFVLGILLPILWLVWTFDGFDQERDNKWYDDNTNRIMFGITPPKGKIVFILLLLGLGYFAWVATYRSVYIYNTSVVYENQYKQKQIERLGFYDKMWKTYFAKDKIATLNKDVFTDVTRLIMENRRDGQNIAWKWVHENQQIPYTEFTKFYSDLSEFVQSQRDAYYFIETQCQSIAIAQNMLLDTFPHNYYNKLFVHRPHITFKYGFLSDSTNEIFKSGVENIH